LENSIEHSGGKPSLFPHRGIKTVFLKIGE